ncbi:probable xyloglucan galactosyltransferase GT17 [Cucurbita maxima]|uniref:Probable xyloglucan galactosyltransferase GT17 n=1 Tax=Cucurbita maxima TaxID=3661 RepID=A0A6J1KS11_CUCMA|nr:probable xyloglucan galactosyltransferase GT17 [Cucurbita maxima]
MFPEFFSMFLRKQTAPIPCSFDRDRSSKNKKPLLNPYLTYNSFLVLSLLLWFLLLYICFPTTIHTKPNDFHRQTRNSPNRTPHLRPTCSGGPYVYVYDLPAEFNTALLQDCHRLSVYTDMCPHVENRGLGRRLSSSDNSWFATHQFIAEMIFHARMENHPCRTRDPHVAKLFYVPFYGGLHASSKFREPNITERDALAVRLVDYVQAQPTWWKNNGRDHFLALGRTAWDFMRSNANGPDFGANCLLNLNAVQNMSVLTVERNPWAGSNQFGIPYASYFHPYTSAEMVTWQNKMTQSNRPHLFTFIGAPRKGLEKAAIRDDIIRQCDMSSKCRLINCRGEQADLCYDPAQVLKIMSQSEFCLQAPGDSFTRRSTFDSILAGCIPVFFSPHTAYTQYLWYLPATATDYSVHIDEKGDGRMRIEEELLKIPREKVKKMRERVVKLIPNVTYKHPNATDFELMDAVDVALAALSKRMARGADMSL